MAYQIYALSDPRDGAVRYVGKTESPLKLRYNHHVFRARSGARHHVYCWIRKLLRDGIQPQMEVVEEAKDHNSLVDAEKFYIEYFRSLGFKLTNLTEGGEGCLGYKHTEETRRKMSAAKKGRCRKVRPELHVLSPDVVEKMKQRYEAGSSATELAAEVGVAALTVLRALRRAGVETRNAGQQRWTSERKKSL